MNRLMSDKKRIVISIVCMLFVFWFLRSSFVMADESLSDDQAMVLDLVDGEYSIAVDLVGGSGKASVSTPTLMIVDEAQAFAKLIWSSSNYDYMIVGDEKYLNQAEEGANSTFVIPILAMDEPMIVIGDTTAMGTPHEVEYELTFHSDTIDSKSALPQEAAKRVVWIALAIIVGGGILNAVLKKKYRE